MENYKKKVKIELYNDHFENAKRYGIPHAQLIIADIPYLELYGYNTQLRSITSGSGTFSYEFARYEQAPDDVAAKQIEERASKLVDMEE